MATLNRQKSYGEIVGDLQGRKYEQDGKYFGTNGEEIVDKSKQAAPAKPAAPVAPKPAVDPAAKSLVDDQLAKQ